MDEETEMLPRRTLQPPEAQSSASVRPADVGLLLGKTDKQIKVLKKRIWCLILLVVMLSVALMIVSILLNLATVSEPPEPERIPGASRDSKRVLLVSFDGFRWDYPTRSNARTPNFDRLRRESTMAKALIPVYPSKTFPNHYSIVTGLYPAWHGIVHNAFCYKDWEPCFNMSNHDPRYWLGEPLWATVASQGKKAYTYFWPGSEVRTETWRCPKGMCMPYDASVPYRKRVDDLIAMLKSQPKKNWPSFMTLYFEETDLVGHNRGPSTPQAAASISQVDTLVGYILDELEAAHALDYLHLVVLGDHGMVDTCAERLVFIDDLLPDWWSKWSNITHVDSWGPVFAACIDQEYEQELYNALYKANQDIDDMDRGMDIYLRDNIPKSYQYNSELSDRICPIQGVAREGYKITTHVHCKKDVINCGCGGAHGYSPELQSMRTIFYGRGARFEPGKEVPAFSNVEVYNVLAEIIGVMPAPNNGSEAFASSLLLQPPSS